MKLKLSLLAPALAVGMASSAQAAWVYYDVDTINTANAADSTVAWSGGGDGTVGWRNRVTTGPAAPAFNETAFTGRAPDNDPPIVTTIAGLDPNTIYDARIYGVFPNNPSSSHFAEVSVDGGTSWQFIDNRNDANIVWVNDANGGVGEVLTGGRGSDPTNLSGDTRYYVALTETLTTNALGEALINLRVPVTDSTGALQDRFNIDGYGLQVVPEPASLSLLGLGGLALLRRRR